MSEIGPNLPENVNSDSDDEGCMGPQLPPDLRVINDDSSIGPSTTRETNSDEDEKQEGDDSDEDMIGPLPPTAEQERRARYMAANEVELRNKKMKDKLTGSKEEAPKREAWMTELPDLVRKNFGMVARGFRQDAGPTGEGRSEWTETPADKEKRRLEAREGKRSDEECSKKKKKKKKHKHESDREEVIQKEVKKYNKKKRGESLIEIHQKKLKKKEKDKEKPVERRAFSREVDLEVNKFDDAKRNRLIKQSAQLNTRFSHGSTTSTFL